MLYSYIITENYLQFASAECRPSNIAKRQKKVLCDITVSWVDAFYDCEINQIMCIFNFNIYSEYRF